MNPQRVLGENFLPTLLCQFGPSAAAKILDSVVDGINMESNAALFICDVNPGVGNLFDAFIAKRASCNFSLQYCAMFNDEISAEWFQQTKAGQHYCI